MSDAPASRPDYDFATVCTDAIFVERTARGARGEPFTKRDVVRIIREQDALRLDRKAPPAPDRRRIPPPSEHVTEYSAAIGYPMDGPKWCDFYAAKGWMTGKTKMKDWQAAVRNWKTNGWGQGTIALESPKPKAGEDYTKI